MISAILCRYESNKHTTLLQWRNALKSMRKLDCPGKDFLVESQSPSTRSLDKLQDHTYIYKEEYRLVHQMKREETTVTTPIAVKTYKQGAR